ncbi:MAG: heme-binding beta-barrel domain-containing protein [Myxococcota bacterium]
MNESRTSELGPLAPLEGVWEGDHGADVSPDDDPREIERNSFRERLTFEPTGLVENHQQSLYGLRYSKVAWRLGAEEPFHEEVGYWLWDAERSEVMLSFIVPRGIMVLAGGKAEPDARSFRLEAEVGSDVFGICSGPFLDAEFKTVRYHIDVSFGDDGSFTYDEDTVMRIKGQSELFHHTDRNTLTKVP